ncbi:hypothetical protein HKX48_007978 [Thoreauomyces humboldtii]|nr:hypothetical protein HKX48_007978 [Thoreauomyces humboldtii]
MRNKVAKCVSMGTQLLANMMTANPDVQDKLWPRYFKESDLLVQLLDTCDIHRVAYALICINNCTMKCRDRCLYLTGTPIGRQLLRSLLEKAARMLKEDCSAFDYVYAIFSNMIELDLTPDIVASLCHGYCEKRVHLLTRCHITFLQLLDGMVSAQRDGPPVEIGIDTAVFITAVVIKVIRHLRKMVGLPETRTPNCPESASITVTEPSSYGHDAEGLVLLIQILGRVTVELGPDAKLKLMRAHLGEALLDLLDFLTIVQPRSTLRTLPPSKNSPSAPPLSMNSDSMDVTSPASSGCTPAPAASQQSPFFMLKADTIKIIANLSYDAKEVQDVFRVIGGVQAVLSQTSIDDDNPFIKEQSVLALRNLLDCNPANQALVASLEPQSIDPSSRTLLGDMGASAQVTADGRVSVGPSQAMKEMQAAAQGRLRFVDISENM